MSTFLLGLTAGWLGVLTGISPCSLATNVAAMSFIGRRVANPQWVLASGLVYTLGRSATYVAVAVLVVSSLLSAPGVLLLQKYMPKILGPLFILLGLVLLEWVTFGGSGTGVNEKMQTHSAGGYFWQAGLLGVVFALSFCPVSAALFFGSLIPLALLSNSPLAPPLLYGLGTGLPVLAFALLLACGARSIGTLFDCLIQAEWWARRATGILFLVLGCYFSLHYIYGLAL